MNRQVAKDAEEFRDGRKAIVRPFYVRDRRRAALFVSRASFACSMQSERPTCRVAAATEP